MQNNDLMITLGAATENPNNVTIAFTMATAALEKGHTVTLILLSNAVALAKRDIADSINIGAPFKPIKELLTTFLEKGGQYKVCKACMVHNGIDENEIIQEAMLISAGDVIDITMASKKSLQFS